MEMIILHIKMPVVYYLSLLQFIIIQVILLQHYHVVFLLKVFLT